MVKRSIIGNYSGQKRMTMSEAGVDVVTSSLTQRLFDRSLSGLKYHSSGVTPFYNPPYTHNFGVMFSEPPIVLVAEFVEKTGHPLVTWVDTHYSAFFSTDYPFGGMLGSMYLDIRTDKFTIDGYNGWTQSHNKASFIILEA